MPAPAGHVQRIVAYILDVTPIVFGVALVYYMFFGLDDVWRRRMEDRHDLVAHADFLALKVQIRTLSFAVLILYGMVMEGSPLQGTLGKFACGLKVVNEAGGRLTVRQAVYRNFSKIISYLAVFLGFLWAFFNADRQTWHDKIASTFVVSRREEVARS